MKAKTIILGLAAILTATISHAQTIYLDAEPAPVQIESQLTQSELKPGWKIVDIQLKSKINRYLWGAKSRQYCDTPRPSFIVNTDSLLLSDLVLIRLKARREYRSIPKPNVHDNKCIFVDLNNFRIEASGEEAFRITPITDLQPGEYIFTWMTARPIGELGDWTVFPFSVK
ncbi:MAG: hypothetical protein IKM92_04965 [Bacteroidaceae bacterium]|jgi:hypothetical protein|nr:hypothetical protein [Bacteroidaceae bacterium]MBR6845944.1 hypothetical protein [Bacteroidaceae bacterium]